jgi:hypothetical protein
MTAFKIGNNGICHTMNFGPTVQRRNCRNLNYKVPLLAGIKPMKEAKTVTRPRKNNSSAHRMILLALDANRDLNMVTELSRNGPNNCHATGLSRCRITEKVLAVKFIRDAALPCFDFNADHNGRKSNSSKAVKNAVSPACPIPTLTRTDTKCLTSSAAQFSQKSGR